MGADRRRGWRRQITYSNLMSTLAVFLVLAGGTALAAGLPKNSVNSKTVKDNSLTSADLADGRGVTGADVADGSLGGADLADGSIGGASLVDGSLPGADLADGSLGAADFAKGTLSAASIGPDVVSSANLLDNSVQGVDLGAEALTGTRSASGGQIDESTLGEVPNAQTLSSRGDHQFVSSDIYEVESPLEKGVEADGTQAITVRCDPGDVLLSGGPIDTNADSDLIENRSLGGAWVSRLDPAAFTERFIVRVICARTLR